MKKQSFISSTPNIMGGALVIAGTRILIARILYLIEEGYTLEQVHEEYPQISLITLIKVIAEFANKHSETYNYNVFNEFPEANTHIKPEKGSIEGR